MCLGVPGQVIEIVDDPLGVTMGKVSFGGITKEVCLAYLPEVRVGDYVIVHVGFAISTIDEEEAEEVFKLLEEMGELAELEVEQPGDGHADENLQDAGGYGAGAGRGRGNASANEPDARPDRAAAGDSPADPRGEEA